MSANKLSSLVDINRIKDVVLKRVLQGAVAPQKSATDGFLIKSSDLWDPSSPTQLNCHNKPSIIFVTRRPG
jgi:hypothetical protein